MCVIHSDNQIMKSIRITIGIFPREMKIERRPTYNNSQYPSDSLSYPWCNSDTANSFHNNNNAITSHHYSKRNPPFVILILRINIKLSEVARPLKYNTAQKVSWSNNPIVPSILLEESLIQRLQPYIIGKLSGLYYFLLGGQTMVA